MTRKDGTFIEASLNAAAVRDANGDYIRTVCMIGEVSQPLRKKVKSLLSSIKPVI